MTLAFASTYVAAANCIAESWHSVCADFEYPIANASADVADLCAHMGWMPGCTLWRTCQQMDGRSDGWCHPMALLDDICHADTMAAMDGCKSAFNSLCHPQNHTSAVRQCQQHPHIPQIPTTGQIKTLVQTMCGPDADHRMDQCDSCPVMDSVRECDLLGMYMGMCREMPGMRGCDLADTLCAPAQPLHNQLPLCPVVNGGSGSDGGNHDGGHGWKRYLPPVMRMYFHFGYEDYVLFKHWVPRDSLSYYATCLAIIVLGVIYEALHTFRVILEFKYATSAAAAAAAKNGESAADCECVDRQQCCAGVGSSAPGENKPTCCTKSPAASPYYHDDTDDTSRPLIVETPLKPPMFQPFNLQRDLMRGALQFLETALSYFLMLIAMSFNVGMFVSVCAGMALGTFALGRFRVIGANAIQSRRCCG